MIEQIDMFYSSKTNSSDTNNDANQSARIIQESPERGLF